MMYVVSLIYAAVLFALIILVLEVYKVICILRSRDDSSSYSGIDITPMSNNDMHRSAHMRNIMRYEAQGRDKINKKKKGR